MASFDYTQITALNDTIAAALNYVVFSGGESKMGQVFLPASTGDLAVTGVGFEPECLLLFGVLAPVSGGNELGRQHFGIATSPSEQWCMFAAASDNVLYASATRIKEFHDNRILSRTTLAGVNDLAATLQSFDADGFTLDFSATIPGATTIPFVYLALRGGGGYECGVATVPGSTGIQAIPVSFTPDLFLVGATTRTANGHDTNSWSFSMGAGDDTRQEAIWAGADATSRNTASRQETGKILTIGRTVTGSASLLAQAELVDLDNGSGEVELDWTTVDGNAYRFGWLAVKNAKTDRFIYVPPGPSTETVTTAISPFALFGFNNSMTAIEDGSFRGGATFAVSACDESLTGELSASFCDFDGSFGNVQQVSVNLSTGVFGSQEHESGNGPGDVGAKSNIHKCDIVDFIIDIDAVFTLVSMNWRSGDRSAGSKRVLVGDRLSV